LTVAPFEKSIKRSSMRRHEGHVDACIIGCGAAGSVLAKELSEAGWKVVVLEAGPWLDTDEDLRQDEVTMRGKFDWVDRRWIDGNEEMIHGHRRDGRGVGGGTIHYGAVAAARLAGGLQTLLDQRCRQRLAAYLCRTRTLLRPRRAGAKAVGPAPHALGPEAIEVPPESSPDDGP